MEKILRNAPSLLGRRRRSGSTKSSDGESVDGGAPAREVAIGSSLSKRRLSDEVVLLVKNLDTGDLTVNGERTVDKTKHSLFKIYLRSFLRRRASQLQLRAFARWEQAMLLERETQQLAEKIAAKSAECLELEKENTKLRVQPLDRAAAPGSTAPIPAKDDDTSESKANAGSAKMFSLEQIEELLQAKGIDPKSVLPSASTGANASPAPSKVDGTLLKDDPDYKEFLKMVKVGVARPAVEGKMKAKGLDPSYLDKDPETTIMPKAGGESKAPEEAPKELNGTLLKDDPDYQPFFKMLKVGVGRPAVEAKMTAKGLDPSYLDNDPETFVVPTNVVPTNETLLKDDPAYQPFFKMLKVGVDKAAVEAKMQAKGLDPTYLDKDPETTVMPKATDGGQKDEGSKGASTAGGDEMVMLKDHELYGPFIKMLLVRIPRPAVEIKMTAKGLDPSFLDKDPKSMIPKSTGMKKEEGAAPAMVKLKDDERYGEFFKMLAVRVPRPAIEAKMRAKGLDPSFLDKDPETLIPEKAAKGMQERKNSAVEMVMLKDDERYGEFFKMLAVRVPRPAIEAKMRVKGLDPSFLDKDPDTMIEKAQKGSSEASPDQKAAPPPKMPEKKPDKIIRRKLHWRKVPGNALVKAGDCMWVNMQRFVFEQREAKEIEKFFSVNVTQQEREKAKLMAEKKKEAPDAESAKKKAAKKKELVCILETPRSNNIAIVLTRMKSKGVTSSEVRRCLFSLDLPDDINFEDINSVLSLLPTPDEEKSLKAYTGPLDAVGKAEKYMLKLLAIPRYKQRIKIFLYKARFEEVIMDISFDFEIVEKACREILEEKQFPKLLSIVLALGNAMNEGPNAPSNKLTQGFSIESLTKLRTVKSFSGQTNALNYMVMVLQSREAQVLNYITEHTENIRSAANVPLTNASSRLATLEQGFKIVTQEHELVSKVVADPEQRDNLSKDETTFIFGLNKFFQSAVAQLEDIRKKADDSVAVFEKTLRLLCEDANTVTSEQFFGNLRNFFIEIETAKNENQKALENFKRQKMKKKKGSRSLSKSPTKSPKKKVSK